MGLTAGEIGEVVREISPVLTGGWIQKVFQPTPRTITLEVRAAGRTHTLLLSAEPQIARLHLLCRRYPNPAVPPPFCQFLRAHIQGAHIERVEQLGGDRIVRFWMTGRAGPCSLVAELTGRSADLLLLDAEDKILADLNTGHRKAGERYRPRVASAGATGHVTAVLQPRSDKSHPFPISSAIEAHYQHQEEELARTRQRQARLAEVRKGIRRVKRRVEALRTDLEKAVRYADYTRYGELLKASLDSVQKGQEQITVVDYFDPALPELVIPLDPSKGPKANMEDYFKKHRKYLAAEREIRPRLQAAERELNTLQADLQAIEQGTWEPPPVSRQKRKTENGQRTTVSGPLRSGPFRRFLSADGLPIYVGRNARENEELTFRLAHSDDLWLHAHGTPGSHVVVRLEKGAEPSPETVKDAATLALLYSDLKKSGKGEVIYTRRKYVRKVKGRTPGTVTVTQEKTIFLQLDRPRLERLKESSH